MHFKLIIALVEDDYSSQVIKAARDNGALGATIISSARGEGPRKKKTFFGLDLEAPRDVILFLVEEHLARSILEIIEKAGNMDQPDTGIAFQIDVEDAVGIAPQVEKLTEVVEEEL